jgi:hypothetical protein
LISALLGAYGTKASVTDVVTTATKLNFPAKFGNGLRKVSHRFFFLFEQVEYKAQGCFSANAGKFGKGSDSVFQ